MNRLTLPLRLALLPLVALIAGCSGSGSPELPGTVANLASTTLNLGPFTSRVVGTAQPPVTSSAVNGANVTGIAGALIDRLTLNFSGARNLSESRIAFYSSRDGNNEIYSMNADGTNQTRITNNAAFDAFPSWSPDGTKIAFLSFRDGNAELYSMNADGTNQTRLTNNVAQDAYPSWSPDGTKIVFSSFRDGNFEIYSMNADGTNLKNLTNNASEDGFPCWSPDGTKIEFYSSRDGNYEIYSMNADGTGVTRLTNNTADDLNPCWSPNGNKIVFYSTRDGNGEIYSMNTDGTNQTRLTNNAAFDGNPCWSPDENKIAFQSFRDGNHEIYSMNTDGTNQTRLTTNVGLNPSWGYLPRTPKTLIGTGGTLGATAAGFLFGLKGKLTTSIVAFDTTTVASRAGARVMNQTANETNGTNLVFSITTTEGLASVRYAPINGGVPGVPVVPAIPAGTTGALVAFSFSDGSVVAVIPYAANKSVPTKTSNATYTAKFTAIFDAKGNNLAPTGASSVTFDPSTGKLVQFH